MIATHVRSVIVGGMWPPDGRCSGGVQTGDRRMARRVAERQRYWSSATRIRADGVVIGRSAASGCGDNIGTQSAGNLWRSVSLTRSKVDC